jgi:hypothetical protein
MYYKPMGRRVITNEEVAARVAAEAEARRVIRRRRKLDDAFAEPLGATIVVRVSYTLARWLRDRSVKLPRRQISAGAAARDILIRAMVEEERTKEKASETSAGAPTVADLDAEMSQLRGGAR